MNEKTVRIKITAKIYDLTDDPGDMPETLSEEYMRSYLEAGDESEEFEYDETAYEMTAEGVMKLEDGILSVTYPEPEENGMGASETRISFDISSPQSVTMSRTGIISTAMVFDEKIKRHICSYDTGIFPIEFCVCTKGVTNGITKGGGILKLDYVIEMRGVQTERNVLILEVYDLVSE